MMDKLRLGVLGCSYHYFKRVAMPLRESLLIEPYAIASRSKEKVAAAARDWGFSVSYDSYEGVLDDPAVDFVYIPLPNHLHLEWIKKAADAGKAILCEKPLGLNALEAKEAVQYCASRDIPLMEAFMYRFHPQWIRARDLAAAHELGEIRAVHSVFSYTNKDPDNIRNIASFGGGALLDIGCYAISSARLLFRAEVLRVFCMLERDPAFGTDSLSSAILDFGNGRRSVFTVGTQMFPAQRVEAYGTGGRMVVELPFNMSGDVPARIQVYTDVGARMVETEIADQYLLEFDAFARALLEGAELPSPPEDAVANMAVLDALAVSAKSGTWAAV